MSQCGAKTGLNTFRPESRQYDDGKETNLYEIALQICQDPPKNPGSICLMMDHEIPAGTDFTTFEFELVSVFAMACIKILFNHLVKEGETVNPALLSEDDWSLLRRYLHSIGYDALVIKEDTSNSTKIQLKFQRYEKPNPYKHLAKYMNP